MKILIDKQFWKSVPREKTNECKKMLEELYSKKFDGTQSNFINSHNGKMMNGTKGISKFGLDKGNRILYGYAKEFQNIKPEYSDGLVILRFACHDRQGDIAKRLNKDAVDIYEYKSNDQTDLKSVENIDFEDNNFEVNNYIKTALFNVINDNDIEKYFENPDGNYDVMLSSEQYHILNDENTPMLLIGCAGSGKTILSVHQMYSFIFNEFDNDGIYFALSSPLLEKSKKIYDKICLNESNNEALPKAQFENFNIYLRQYLNKKEKNFVNYNKFEIGFYNNINRDLKGLNALDIWTEIRGVIKGYMGENWKWNNLMHQSNITDSSIKYLEKYGYIIRHNSNKQYITLNKDSDNNLNDISNDEELSEKQKAEIRNAFKKVKNHYNSFDSEKKYISSEEYFNLNSECSVYDNEHRKIIYDVFLEYKDWLDKYSYYDDNDLSRDVTEKLIKYKDNLPFSCAIVDEAQDFTEMQLFTIFNMISDKSKILFAGDVHQVINPTYFNEERISRLFFENNLTLNIQSLTKNFRSQKEIVNFANAIAKLRIEKIGSRSKRSEELEVSVIKGCIPFNLLPTRSNLTGIINRINELPYAAVIVQDEKEKNKLIGLIEDSEYSGNIFTIQEIKGLEYRYIFCYNMISKFSNEWNDIFTSNSVRKNAKYRFYFNTFYVGVTRAQEYLCIYEDSIPDAVNELVYRYTDSVKEYDENAMFLLESENVSEEWFKSAQILEEKEMYENAIIQYKKSNVIDLQKHILRCEIKQYILEDKYYEATEKCLQLKDYELLKKVAENSENEDLGILAKALCDGIQYAYVENQNKNEFINNLFQLLQKPKNSEDLINHSIEISIEQTLKNVDIITQKLFNITNVDVK